MTVILPPLIIIIILILRRIARTRTDTGRLMDAASGADYLHSVRIIKESTWDDQQPLPTGTKQPS